MSVGPGPASSAARRAKRMSSRGAGPRPYALPEEGADARDVALAATRALVRCRDSAELRHVVATLVGDLGGALVPARFEPSDALPLDVSLGVGEPVLVVVAPVSLSAMGLGSVLPGLVEDAKAVLARLDAVDDVRPGSGPVEPELLPRYLRLLDRGDSDAATALVRHALRAGTDPTALVQDVLAPAQREVGERWYRGEWTVADEHAATAVTEAATAALPAWRDGPRVVVCAPEGEWHALPGRLLAAAARDVRATVLGPGLPAEHLRRYLEATSPDAVVLSVTMATGLLPALDAVAAAHDAGVPVVAGGRALGDDDTRALAVGADAWAAAPAELAALVPGLEVRGVVPAAPVEALQTDAVADEVLLLALERHAAAAPRLRTMSERQRRHTVADLRWIARHGGAALVCDDPRVVDELLGWLDVLLRDRGVPAHVLPDSVRYLAEAMEPQTPAVAAVLQAAAERLR